MNSDPPTLSTLITVTHKKIVRGSKPLDTTEIFIKITGFLEPIWIMRDYTTSPTVLYCPYYIFITYTKFSVVYLKWNSGSEDKFSNLS